MLQKFFFTSAIIAAFCVSFHCSDDTTVTNGSNPSITFERKIQVAYGSYAHEVIPTSDASYILVGTVVEAQSSPSKMLLMKLDRYGNERWSNSSDEMSFAHSIMETGDKGFIILGSDVMKTDSSGRVEWKRRYFAKDQFYIRQALPAVDGGYIISCESSGRTKDQRMVLLKIDDQGNFLWSHEYGSPEYKNYFHGMIRTYDGNYYLLRLSKKLVNSFYRPYYFLTKIDMQGNIINEIPIDTTTTIDLFNFIQVLPDKIAVTGRQWVQDSMISKCYFAILDSRGGIITELSLGSEPRMHGYGIDSACDGGLIVQAESTSADPEADMDTHLLKFNSRGDLLWGKKFEGTYFNRLNSMHSTSDGGIILAGYSRTIDGRSSIRLIKTDWFGNY